MARVKPRTAAEKGPRCVAEPVLALLDEEEELAAGLELIVEVVAEVLLDDAEELLAEVEDVGAGVEVVFEKLVVVS